MSTEAGITIRGINETCAALTALPRALATQLYFEALRAAIEPVFAALLSATPEQPANESGGMFDDPGGLRAALDYAIQLDSQGRGGRAGLGYGKYSAIARLVEFGHQMVTHKGVLVGSVASKGFARRTFDGPVMLEAVEKFAQVIVARLESLRLI